MEYFKPGEYMRIMYYSVSGTGILGKNTLCFKDVLETLHT